MEIVEIVESPKKMLVKMWELGAVKLKKINKY